MWGVRGLNWRTGLYWLAIFAAVAIVGGGLFAASGIYNVAASKPHLPFTTALIEFVLRRSVATHSLGVTAPDLKDEGLVRLGANHFQLGCAPCHGSPAGSNDPIVGEMYPEPPPLAEAVESWDTEELFWIVRHGLKFTGMPGWSGEGRDDEVWALVAFLEELPGMEKEEFRKLVGDESGSLIDFGERQAPDFALCASCHGDGNSPPISDVVPVLQGQSAACLRRSLEEYSNDMRQSGIMEPIAAALDDKMIAEAAQSYSAMDVPATPEERDPETVARGREIAEQGIPEKQIPACLACHSGRASDQFPILSGLSAKYIEGQLELFREGVRDRTAYGAIMTTIAQRLSPSQIKAAAAYFASLPVGEVPSPPDGEARRR